MPFVVVCRNLVFMKTTLFIFCLAICQCSFCQFKDTLAITINQELFSHKEIKDSGYRHIQVVRHSQFHESAKRVPNIFIDTIYEAWYNAEGSLTKEFSRSAERDSIISFYVYTPQNLLQQIKIVHYNALPSGGTGIPDTVLKNYSNGILDNEVYKQPSEYNQHSTFIQYYYTRDRRLKQKVSTTGSYEEVTMYYHDAVGKLTREVWIACYDSKRGQLKDSIVTIRKYDNRGQLLEVNKQPSDSYYLTFTYEDTNVDAYEKYKYDNEGRKIYSSNINLKEWASDPMLKYAYSDKAYKKVYFEPRGYTEKWYDNKNKLTETNYYHIVRQNLNSYAYKTELFNQATKFTDFISPQSSLPETIQYYSSVYSKRYFFQYSK